MSDDKLPTVAPADPRGDPDQADDELLRRAAREVRAAPGLRALVPLSAGEREQLASHAIELALRPASGSVREPSIASRVTALRPQRKRTLVIVVAATLGLAAAVALVLRGGPAVEPLASYAMVVEGEAAARGAAPTDPGEPVLLRPETRLRVLLESDRPERDALVRLLIVGHGRAAVLDPSIARPRAGSLSIEGAAGSLLGAATDGPAELVLVLGRALPDDAELRALALDRGRAAPRSLQVLRRSIVLVGFSRTAIDVLLGGCSAVVATPGVPGVGARCEIAAGAQLQLWVGAAAGAVAIELDGRPIAPSAVARGAGAGFALDAPAGPCVLAVRVDARPVASWQLAPAPSFPQIRAAEQARVAGQLDAADAALDQITGDASAEERLDAVRWRAKVAFRRGDVATERLHRERAVASARALGRVSVELDELVALIYSLRNDHALTQAMRLLPALDAHASIYAEGAARRELVHGLLASDLGDLGAALGSFQRALAIADRIADAPDRAAVVGPLADVLQALGRDGEVRALIDAELARAAHDADACARVDALTNAGWLLRDVEPVRAQGLADQAAELAVASCQYRVPLAQVNQGWLFAAAHRFGDARRVVDRLARAAAPHDGLVATWALRLEAETVLGEDPEKAERYAQPLAARAATLCSSELAYEAELLRARALVALDRPIQAAAAFAQAERKLALWSHLVPLGEGRATFFQRHDQLALTAIPFFLAQARVGAAGAELALAATLRRSLARFVGSLAGGGQARVRAQRGATGRDVTSRRFEQTLDRWPGRLAVGARPGEAVAGVCEVRDAAALAVAQAAPSTLAAAPSGWPARIASPWAATLFVHPAADGWLVVAWRGAKVELRELRRGEPREDPVALSDRIAQAAAPMLAGAPRVHLDVHRSVARLPLDRSLAALLGVPIAFAVAAPPRAPGKPCTTAARALVVTNPQQNLWAASAAAPRIRGDLERIGFAVDLLDGAAATRMAIEARLADPCTALFHYDGHGRELAGAPTSDRTDDALLLAGGDTLTAADVLELARVPAAVVLNGCTTAAPEGLGLAQAFLLAGAAQVVASLEEVPADAAARFTRSLFGSATAEAGGTGLDLVRLFALARSATAVPALRVFER
jgi:cellulose synthase operon protein C